MDPRGYSGAAAYDAPIDVYALGVVLYLMLLGFHDAPEDFPFDTACADFPAHVAARARARLRFTTPGHAHHDRAQGLSPQALDLLSRMLDPSPAARITAQGVLAHAWLTAPPPQLHSAAALAHAAAVPYGFAPARRAMNVRLLASVAAGQCKATLERFHGVARCLSPGDAQRIYAEFHALAVRREMAPGAGSAPGGPGGARLVSGITRAGMLALLASEHVAPAVAEVAVARVFEELDRDHDGLVRWKDFVAVIPLLSAGPLDAHYPAETLRLFWDIWCGDGAWRGRGGEGRGGPGRAVLLLPAPPLGVLCPLLAQLSPSNPAPFSHSPPIHFSPSHLARSPSTQALWGAWACSRSTRCTTCCARCTACTPWAARRRR